MAIDTNTPTIRPPTAEDMQNFNSGGAPTTTIAPPTSPQYETPEGSFPAGGASDELDTFASNAMDNPSRYDNSLIKDFTSQIDEELKQKKLVAGTELDEFMSSRGMVGSSVEGELRRGMLGDMERMRQERLNDLNKSAADTWAADRAGAADIGFKSAEFKRALGGDEVNEERWKAEFGQSQYEWEKQYGSTTELQQRALDLQETGMEYEEAFRQAKLEIESGQFESEQERIRSEFEAELGEVRATRMQDFGFKKDEFDLAVKAQQDQAETEGRRLDIEEARDLAEQDLRLQQLEQEAELAGETIDLDRERLKIQNEQFTESLGQEQQALEEARQTRLAQIGIESGRLQNETLRIQQEAELAGREMDLQSARDRAEVELRTADRMEEARQSNQALTWEEARMESEELMFADELAARQSEFSDRLNLEKTQYQEQVAARKAEYTDRNAQRLADLGLQEGSLAHDSAMKSADRLIETEALRLQEEGMDNEAAWQEAQRATMERLENSAQSIQEKGLTAEQSMNQARVDAQKAMATERTKMEKEIANIQDKDAKAERIKQYEEMRLQRLSTETLESAANTIQETAVDNELAIATANREAEYEDRAKDRSVKAWATAEDLKQREREYKKASADKRLEMILEAVKNNVDLGDLTKFIQKHQETTKETGLSGAPAPSTSEGTDSQIDDWDSTNDGLPW